MIGRTQSQQPIRLQDLLLYQRHEKTEQIPDHPDNPPWTIHQHDRK